MKSEPFLSKIKTITVLIMQNGRKPYLQYTMYKFKVSVEFEYNKALG